MKKPIPARMVFWILSGTLLAFILFNMVSYYLLERVYSDRLASDNQIHTRNVALSVSSFYETVYAVVGEMAQAGEIRSLDPARQQEYIRERFAQYDYFSNLVIQKTPDGTQTARVRGEKAIRPERWWFQRLVKEKRPFITPSFYSFGSDSNDPTTAMAVVFPVFREDAMVSSVAAFLRIEEIQERVGRHYRGDDRYTYILDEDGTMIAHPEWEKVKLRYNYKKGDKALVARDSQGKYLLDGQDYRQDNETIEVAPGLRRIVESVLAGESGTAEYVELDGKVMFCSYSPVAIPGYGAAWAAITVQDKALAMAPLQRTIGQNAVLSFLVLAGLATMILRQSREMERNAQQLAQANASLEEEVGERTRAETELTAANEELTAMNEEMLQVTEELQQANHQMLVEIDVRQATESKLLLRERQYRAMFRLISDNEAEFDVQMQGLLASARELVNAADGFVILMENNRPFVRYIQGSKQALLGSEVTRKTGLLPTVLATGKLQYREDYQSLPDRLRGPLWDNLRTVAIFPLKQKEQVAGAVAITWNDEIRQLSADELEMLQQFSDLAALALQDAKIREALRHELLQQERLHEKISHMAYHDALTGLPNRACLMERLKVELEAAAQGAGGGVVFFIDLDDLKSINDNFGHLAGDRLIVAAGETIQALAGEKAFVARLGGDEFIVVLPDRLETAEISRLGDRLVEGLCQDYPFADEAARVSASVGIALFPQDGMTVEELMKKADNAMYAAKAAGRNCWRFFDPAMLRDAQEKLLLTNSLRHALAKNEFRVAYQPQVDLKNGRVIGFEALLRWNSKEHGSVPPGKFILLAEQNQLIVPIGIWVLEQACVFARRISRLGFPDVRVAVNLSPKQLADENLIREVDRILGSSGIAARQLELEITESALLASIEESSRKLHQLEALGVRLALDDFGTGYSSLTYLRLFPVETLKIDKTFIDNIPERETVLVQSLIRFAQSLEIHVVAEGVERQEQWDYLRECGCDVGQGFLICRPTPEEDAIRFLLAKNRQDIV